MGLFSSRANLPQFMQQAVFDASIFDFYLARFQFETFDSFWHAKTRLNDGTEKRLIDTLFSQIPSYPKDSLLRSQLSQGCLDLEKFWFNKYGISPESLVLFAGIRAQAEGAMKESLAVESGSQDQSDDLLSVRRADDFLKNLREYDLSLSKLNLGSFDEETKTHFLLSDLDDSLAPSFRYRGSVLKVIEQDSYAQDDDITWGRWTLFRDATGFVDIWIVRIESGKATVMKIISRLADGSYKLDETPLGIQFDSEIFKAIDKTIISAFENSEAYSVAPGYYQMISMVEALGG